ncbi:protein phosphatase type 2C [Thecamonas trahens ATCC 50062]|uniref:Protein phosphatase type 2C n=1 Tax=Thecamonas trahens ATCC 50062 TaxID=461836 RepID=A0A0L0D8K9_THETB|nr:protein phosphatase type 2C [Thecamonas trahens ATCC 50062]KNC48679.1 protein phosphatase type 2C [Thecamonas trahens ATCC 50062]|eukprot:XP_013762735.1 protein phosphatase type 2C [Thecamonas trahens ATCC 50062]
MVASGFFCVVSLQLRGRVVLVLAVLALVAAAGSTRAAPVELLTVPDDANGFPTKVKSAGAVAVDGKTGYYVSLVEGAPAAPWHLHMWRCDLDGAAPTCSQIMGNDAPASFSPDVALAVGPPLAGPLLVYSGSAGLVTVACLDETCGSVNSTTHGSVNVMTASRLRVARDGGARLPVITMRLSNTDGMVVACNNVVCSSATSSKIFGSQAQPPKNADLSAVASDNEVFVGYQASSCSDAGSPTEAEYISCTTTACSAMTPVAELATIGKCTSSWLSGMTHVGVGEPVNKATLPYVFFYNLESDSIMLARCTNAECGNPVVQTVTEPGVSNWRMWQGEAETVPLFVTAPTAAFGNIPYAVAICAGMAADSGCSSFKHASFGVGADIALGSPAVAGNADASHHLFARPRLIAALVLVLVLALVAPGAL